MLVVHDAGVCFQWKRFLDDIDDIDTSVFEGLHGQTAPRGSVSLGFAPPAPWTQRHAGR